MKQRQYTSWTLQQITALIIHSKNFLIISQGTGRIPCPLDPYYIMPDKCKCVDFQVLKLQEAPDAVPNGEMPRHMQLYCDR